MTSSVGSTTGTAGTGELAGTLEATAAPPPRRPRGRGSALRRQNFATSIRNNFYFVLFVVPLQTALALFLAVLLNNKFLRGRSYFRTAFFFPSVTSSIATTLVFLFLFSGGGAVNQLLGYVGLHGPNWTADPRGVFHQALGAVGVDSTPGWARHEFFNLSWWDWFSGPSIAMIVIITLVVWTTSGTFMLMFLAGLQNINEEVLEARRSTAPTPGSGSGW